MPIPHAWLQIQWGSVCLYVCLSIYLFICLSSICLSCLFYIYHLSCLYMKSSDNCLFSWRLCVLFRICTNTRHPKQQDSSDSVWPHSGHACRGRQEEVLEYWDTETHQRWPPKRLRLNACLLNSVFSWPIKCGVGTLYFLSQRRILNSNKVHVTAIENGYQQDNQALTFPKRPGKNRSSGRPTGEESFSSDVADVLRWWDHANISCESDWLKLDLTRS